MRFAQILYIDLMQADKIDGSTHWFLLTFIKLVIKWYSEVQKTSSSDPPTYTVRKNRRKMSYEKISCTVSCLRPCLKIGNVPGGEGFFR